MLPEIQEKLQPARNIWVATVRPDGRPHLTPVWFVLWEGKIVFCISGRSVKAANLSMNASVALALEDGSSPLICEGTSEQVAAPWPAEVAGAFKEKYDWAIETDDEYDQLVAVTPLKWLRWGG